MQRMSYLFAFTFIIKLLECLYPFQQPLFNHLDLLALWPANSTGKFAATNSSLTSLFQTGLFDYLYIIPQLFWGNGEYTLIISQIMHYFAGLGAASLLLFFAMPKPLGALMGLALLLLPQSSDIFLSVGSMGVVSFITLIISMLYIKMEQTTSIVSQRKLMRRIGICLGLLASLNIHGLIMAGCFFLPVISRFGLSFGWPLYTILAFSPIMLRNIYSLGTPFYAESFPLLAKHTFPISTLLPTLWPNIKSILFPKAVFIFLFSGFRQNILYDLLIPLLLYSITIFTLYTGNTQAQFFFPVAFVLVYCLGNTTFIYHQKANNLVFICTALLLIFIDSTIVTSVRRIYHVVVDKNRFSTS